MPCVLNIVLVICDSNPERVTPSSLGLRNRLSEVKQLPQGHLPEWGGTRIHAQVCRTPKSVLSMLPVSLCHCLAEQALTRGLGFRGQIWTLRQFAT